jgi:uncharacterized protein (DUF2147 family)
MKHSRSHATRTIVLGLAILAGLTALPNEEANAQEHMHSGANAVPLTTDPAQAVGDWQDDDGSTRIRVTKDSNGKFVGRILWMKQPNGPDGKPLLDSKNPDEKLRSRPLVGIAVFYNLSVDDDELTGGIAYDFESGKFYKCKMALDGANTLKIRGYAGFSLLGQTVTMKRIP